MRFYISILLTALLLTSCEKSIEKFSVTNIIGGSTDTVWATSNSVTLEINQLQQSLKRANISDSFNIQAGKTLQVRELQIEVPASAFLLNGAVASGTAQVDYILLQSKGDLIRFSKPSFGNSNLLKNLGSLYINFTKSGQALNLISSKYLRITLSDSLPATSVKGYVGVIPSFSSFTNFSWSKNDSLTILTSSTGYSMYSNRQQWLNFAYPIDSATPKSRVVLSMPAGYTNSNTLAFIAYQNSNSVMQFVPDATNRIWLAESVPTGKSVTYITITKSGNDYWLGTQQSTTAYNQNIRIVPEKKSLQSINNFLDSL